MAGLHRAAASVEPSPRRFAARERSFSPVRISHDAGATFEKLPSTTGSTAVQQDEIPARSLSLIQLLRDSLRSQARRKKSFFLSWTVGSKIRKSKRIRSCASAQQKLLKQFDVTDLIDDDASDMM